MLVSQLLTSKGRQVFTVTPDDTLSSVAALLYTRKVGAFVVTDRVGRVVGIISERDIIRAIATTGAEALVRPVNQIMTRDVISASMHETVEALLDRMTDRRIRHLPVMEGARLIGIVSIGDLVKARIAASEHEARTLKEYIAG
ncbi:CBS domain-containing protein [Asticcacaulis sp. EMRT-3]|uniref:CBS domain-containing protein n=1 Tax=Asticcacaulis sp. EMRT-3 TaxID=3040349 RepID=UPI0024AFF44F|nr:CBS domain-containing protein [Asticcacaulis sp. EMRT-3]MDI7774157.1 CBS domain-containing protein [Asticcacaulis sp. EMRT-3]